VNVLGEKFEPEPAPCGIVTVYGAAVLEVVVEVVVLLVVVEVVEVVVLLVVPVPAMTVRVPCIHPGWNWHS